MIKLGHKTVAQRSWGYYRAAETRLPDATAGPDGMPAPRGEGNVKAPRSHDLMWVARTRGTVRPAPTIHY